MTLAEIEEQVCAVTGEQLQIPREQFSIASRLIDDLHCDSLDLSELIMELEDRFDVTIPDRDSNPICKSIFTRKDFRLSDLAETVYVQQGTGKPHRESWRNKRPTTVRGQIGLQFCQLGGRWNASRDLPLFEKIDNGAEFRHYRRRSDGMRCVWLPAATVQIGTDDGSFDRDARPQHIVQLDSFLIDAETVSTTAYCRFLNSIGDIAHGMLLDWFVLTEGDGRVQHVLIENSGSGWQPVPGCEAWPMILVSWYGANAYSLWANGKDWRNYRGEGGGEAVSFLPTEAQWEYAARGPEFTAYPWGDEPVSDDKLRYGRHALAESYTATTLPLAAVNETLGMSPFGLHHMAGNVWQWCRDWYDDHFYSLPEASEKNPCNRSATGVRSERGGSWVGPAELCRSSHRRGRSPAARGRCLGFRCVGDASNIG